jgi:S-formylglutathione hydrolase FrmB
MGVISKVILILSAIMICLQFAPPLCADPLNNTTDFVKQQYRDFLNREADAGGLAHWVNQIDSGAMTRAQVIDSFFWSDEFGVRIAPIVRLYFAYFLRIPDYAGLMYWVDASSSGASLWAVSDSFAGSEEFGQRYGSLSNEGFVELIYQNILGRTPDSGGYAYWVGELNSGRQTRGQVMVGFSESDEYKSASSNEVFVTMMYIGMLRRSPEQGGFDFWVNQLDSGGSGLALIDGFLNSQEYANRSYDAGSPQFRAIGGVSMGAYGAMNIGLGRPDFFNTIASLGGPLDMAYLLKFIEVDILGNYDNPTPYPGRGTLINMLKDLTISFGNPVYYNPLSTYYPPGITAQNARTPTTLYVFIDELNPDGSLPVITYEDPNPGDWVEVLLALDGNRDGKRNLGEPILRQFYEPFTDQNGNKMYDLGEPFSDTGLDGVPVTGDIGEGDGKFTYNPNHGNYFAEDPLSHAETLRIEDLEKLNLYIDAGTEDEFQFNIHAEAFVDTLRYRGLNVRIENDFPEDFPRISHFDEKRVYVRYPGGHVGFNKEDIGLSFEQAKQGIEEAIVVANRFTTLFSFVSDHFTGGDFGTNPLELVLYPSEMKVAYFTSSSLNRTMRFGIYLPPGYSRRRTNYYPVLYLLLGYNMSVDGITNSSIKIVLDSLILTGEMQKMIIVIPDGLNYKNQNGQKGHFFVNQIDQERGDKFKDYFFDLVTFIDTHYKTK